MSLSFYILMNTRLSLYSTILNEYQRCSYLSYMSNIITIFFFLSWSQNKNSLQEKVLLLRVLMEHPPSQIKFHLLENHYLTYNESYIHFFKNWPIGKLSPNFVSQTIRISTLPVIWSTRFSNLFLNELILKCAITNLFMLRLRIMFKLWTRPE